MKYFLIIVTVIIGFYFFRSSPTERLKQLQNQVNQFKDKNYDELSDEQKSILNAANRERVELLKKRIDERLQRLML